jgi:hypothetical protein
MPEYFVTRSGRRIADPDTDQAGSAALIRTVSRYTDGAPIDRPQPCVAIAYAGGPERARELAELLDRRGYLPPERPMNRGEFEALDQRYRWPEIWSCLGEGLPAGLAIERHGGNAGDRTKQRALRRAIKAIWT